MIAGRLDVSVDRAFELLRAHARTHRQRLHEVARDVVDGQQVPGLTDA